MQLRSIRDLEKDGAITAIQDGNHGAQHPKASDYIADGIPFIMASDITDDGIVDLALCKRISKALADRLRIGFSRPGDILLTHKGTVGRVALSPPVDDYVMLTPQVTYYRLDERKISPRYLIQALRSPPFQSRLVLHSAQSTRPYISISAQRDLLVPWWELPTQRRIAEILSAYDDLIENNTRRIAILEDMARRLFEEWFGRETESKDAKPVRIDSMIDFDPRTKVSKQGLKPFLPMPCVPTNSMVVSEWEAREGNAGSKFLNGDTLLARITPCLENGKTAFVDFLPEGEAGFGSTEFIVMRGRVVPPEFVYRLARSEAFREHAIKSMSGATGRQRVSSAAVAQFEMGEPDPERLRKFGAATRPMFAMVRSLADANTNLRTTRDLLLPKLISGEIEVRFAEDVLEAAAA